MEAQPRLVVNVVRRSIDPSGAIRYDLRPDSGGLPRFKAGAHIDMFLPNGLIRSYSLMNDEGERDRYVCGVGLDRDSRGGSAYLHEHVVEGSKLTISEPKNLFGLTEDAARSILFAGGIGVTPLIAMVRRLTSLGRDWRLYFCARSRALAPFLHELRDHEDRVVPRFDDEVEGFLDFKAVIAAEPVGTHFYCCGPSPMISAFEAAANAGLPTEYVHTERFSSDEAPATEGGFTVELVRSGLTVQVESGKTILEAIEAAGVDVPFSCLAGICGSCVTKVLEGTPDHRDLVLTDRERRRNDRMMICCSGSLSSRLVLDR